MLVNYRRLWFVRLYYRAGIPVWLAGAEGSRCRVVIAPVEAAINFIKIIAQIKDFQLAGLFYEDFFEGQEFEHQPGRTVTEMDNTLFSALTMNPQPLHLDAEFAKNTEFGERLVNSIFTLGLMIGLTVGDTTLGTTIANLGMTDIKFPKPVFHGDTIRARTTIISKRESKSRPQAGIVEFEHRAINQRGEEVASCKRTGLMKKRE